MRNRVHVEGNHVAVAAGDAEYIEMSPWSIGIVPDIVISRLNKSQIVFHHKPAGVDFVHGNRRGDRHIEKFSSAQLPRGIVAYHDQHTDLSIHKPGDVLGNWEVNPFHTR